MVMFIELCEQFAYNIKLMSHSIWEKNDFKTNLLQLSSFTNLIIINISGIRLPADR